MEDGYLGKYNPETGRVGLSIPLDWAENEMKYLHLRSEECHQCRQLVLGQVDALLEHWHQQGEDARIYDLLRDIKTELSTDLREFPSDDNKTQEQYEEFLNMSVLGFGRWTEFISSSGCQPAQFESLLAYIYGPAITQSQLLRDLLINKMVLIESHEKGHAFFEKIIGEIKLSDQEKIAFESQAATTISDYLNSLPLYELFNQCYASQSLDVLVVVNQTIAKLLIESVQEIDPQKLQQIFHQRALSEIIARILKTLVGGNDALLTPDVFAMYATAGNYYFDHDPNQTITRVAAEIKAAPTLRLMGKQIISWIIKTASFPN